MGARLGTSGGPMADINVTPLIDVVLVLLVVFMVVTPLLQSGKAVDLPVATQATSVNDVGQYITVSVTKDGKWWVETSEADETSLVGLINEEFAKNPERQILVKGDANLEYQQVREVMDVLAEVNMTSVLVATAKEE